MQYAPCAKYGDLGRIIKDEKYYEPHEVDTSSYKPERDPLKSKFDELKEKVKARMRIIEAIASNKTSAYNFIMQRLSRESKYELKRIAGYDKVHSENDPLKLWKALKDLHLTTTASLPVAGHILHHCTLPMLPISCQNVS